MRNLSGTELKRLHRDWRRRTDGRIALLLDSVQTPYNVGSILRLAAANGVEHLWLVGATESPTHNKTAKTALGSERYLTWSAVDEPTTAIEEAREQGFRVVGVELTDDAVPIQEADLSGPICLAVGHEDRGLAKTTLAHLDATVYVPQVGKIASLNVAAATAIALYETRRQEWRTA